MCTFRPLNLALLSVSLSLLFLSLSLHRNVPTPLRSMTAFPLHHEPPPLQPPPQQQHHHHHQVFINFRGEELRYSFVSHLGETMKRHGINFFIDKHEERGKDLETLFKRIEDSTIALAIFSPRYAESEWCLEELVKMMEREKMGKLRVIPIFFKVEPREVKYQEGDLGRRFWRLARSSHGGQIMRWKDALESVSRRMGLTLGEKSYENEFIKEIVVEVEKVITAISFERLENVSINSPEIKIKEKGLS